MDKIGIIGGSGLYEIEGFTAQEWAPVETPFGAPSDEFLTGQLSGRDVVFLPRHGRGHRLMPSELNHRANIWAMKHLGVSWIISASAVGSLQPQYAPCNIVLIDQFIDNTKQSTTHTFFGDGIVGHVGFADPICDELRRVLLSAAVETGVKTHDRGTYVNMEGPAFSTRAESLRNQKLGFDVIGMTNLGEARCAREAEISYATLALVTDYDCWKVEEEPVSVKTVIANLQKNTTSAKEIIRKAILEIPTAPAWPSQKSLDHAIMTTMSDWPSDTVERLRPIIGRFL
ncbi:S-methyl-5'-thioadenosine phosphorylase [bacterium]|nr:S-methyl-5'-thioadenosine phosphorylase [bacterium]MDA7680012.1 S-methyl-5'-thioadenosine phosphorylase [bacterium]MDB4683973.1 S-methyl-5'-thioadenosine phosphorylase [bacterium]